MAVTMKQIATMAGVSIGTVDRALKDKGRVAPDVAARIKQIAEALDYRPNTVAKSLANRNKNLTIGVVTHVKINDYYSEVIKGIEQAAIELDDFGISVTVKYGSDFDPYVQLQLIEEILAEGISALAIIPINHPLIAAKIEELQATGFPVVFLSTFIEKVTPLAYVGGDWHKAGTLAGGILNIITAGRKANVLAITPSLQMLGHQRRLQAFENILATRYTNLTLCEVIELEQNSFRNYELVKQHLIKHDRIDYIFCNSSRSAIQAIEEYAATKYADVKMIGLDYTDSIERGLASGLILATITQQPQEQGYHAIKILFDYLTKNTAPPNKNCYMEHQIIIKESIE